MSFASAILRDLATAVEAAEDKQETSSELKIPFSEFFDKFFRDESGNLPDNNGYRFFFTETMNSKQWDKFSKKCLNIEEKNNFDINLTNCNVVIDASITGNYSSGVFLVVGDKPYFTLKDSDSDWEKRSNIKKMFYEPDDRRLYIQSFEFSTHSEDRPMLKQLVDCFNAYINQNKTQNNITSEKNKTKPLTSVLGNIDNRIKELEAKRDKLLAFEHE